MILPKIDTGINGQHAIDALRVLLDPTDNVEVCHIAHDGRITTGHRVAEYVCSDEYLAELAHADTLRGGVFFGPNPSRELRGSGYGGRRKDGDVLLARCVFVDFDDHNHAAVMAAIRKAGLPDPTLIVYTRGPEGDGWHCYWRLTEPITDLEQWRALQKALAKALGSDPTICNPSRLMRLPGSYNWKRGARCGIHTINPGLRYDLAAWPIAPEGRPSTPCGAAPGGRSYYTEGLGWSNLSRKTQEFLEGSIPAGERNARLFAAAIDIHGNAIPYNEAEATLFAAALRHGLGRGESQRAIRSAFKRTDATPARRGPIRPDIAKVINAMRGRPVVEGSAA